MCDAPVHHICVIVHDVRYCVLCLFGFAGLFASESASSPLVGFR
jgi:hypothetical protein